MTLALPPKILIIEDDPKHMDDAKQACIDAGFTVGVNAFFRTNVEDALRRHVSDEMNRQFAGGPIVDGVITDLFVPYRDDKPEDQPCGLVVVEHCKRENIPCVVCTSGHHHGHKYMWMTKLLKDVDVVEMSEEFVMERIEALSVDNPKAQYDRKLMSSIDEEEAPSKDWAKAIKWLLKMIERNLAIFSSPVDPE